MLKRISGLLMLLFVAAPLVGVSGEAMAQANQLKIGYTDHELIIVNMNQYRTVQQQLQQEAMTMQEELQGLSQEFQTKLEQYQKQQSLLSEQSRQQREQELMTLQQNLQEAAAEREQNLQDREAELMRPLFQRVQTAIDEVAQQQGLDLVLRSQIGIQPLILYVNEDRLVDITRDVARKLGINVDEPAANAAPASN